MTETISLPIKGMHCASCAQIIEKVVKKQDGVQTCEVNYGTEKAAIKFDPDKTTPSKLSNEIKKYGYEFELSNEKENHAEHLLGQHHKEESLKIQKQRLEFLLPVTIMVFVLMMWEIASGNKLNVPLFFLPHKLYSTILFIVSSIVLFWGGKQFVEAVGRFIKFRVANMDTLIGIGTLTAYLYSSFILLFSEIATQLKLPVTNYFDVTIVVIGFVTLGKYLEARSKSGTGKAIEKLIGLQAKTAIIKRDGQEMEVPIDKVILDDEVVIKPGGKIPVDGIVIEGKSFVDESMITGEPIPNKKEIDDTVIGGTINKNGTLTVKATKVGSQTLLAEIIRLVESAQGSKAPIQKLADQISAVFVPSVLVIASLSFILWLIIGSQFMTFNDALTYGLLSFVGVLVIACPCALGLATPTAIIVGVGKGAQNGILIKNAESLEKLHKVTTVVVDKTGTITNGKPVVTDISIAYNSPIQEVEDIKILLASLEKNSEHPLASAIVEYLQDSSKIVKVTDFHNVEGQGVIGKFNDVEYLAGNIKLMESNGIKFDSTMFEKFAAEGKTPVLFAQEKQVIATIAISDTIKETSIKTVEFLHKLGIKVVMLTGDNEKTAKYIADQVGIDKIFAQVLPKDKSEKIKEIQENGEIVAMAGDGVNDAPALAQSDVGIAMGNGTDIAIESADIALLGGDISKIPQVIRLSKNTISTVKQNLFWAFVYNLVGIPLASGLLYPIFGILLNPAFAGMAMTMSSVSVVLNSLRLQFTKIK